MAGRFEIDDKIRAGLKTAFGGLSQPEGLATAAVGGFVFGGPVGLALGVAQGLLAKRMHQSALDDERARMEMLQGFDATFKESLARADALGGTELDKAQLSEIGRQFQMYSKLSMSPDEGTREGAYRAMAELSSAVSVWQEDLEGRNESMQDRGINVIDEQVDFARGEFAKGLAASQDIAAKGEQIHSILASGEDINSGPIRAQLAGLLGTTTRELLADPEDFNDALVAIGGAVGPIGEAIGAYLKGKGDVSQFTFTKEQWRTIAYAMQVAGKRQSETVMQNAAAYGQKLDEAYKRVNYEPPISATERIITGRTQDAPEVSGKEGGYGGNESGALASKQAPADPLARVSQAFSEGAKTIAEKSKAAITSPALDPTGFWKQFVFREQIEEDDPRVTSGFLQPRHGRDRRRPTN